MKKLIILLTLIFIFSLAGCTVVKSDEEKDDKKSSSVTESEKENSEETGSNEDNNYLSQSDKINSIEFKRVSGKVLLTEEDVESVAVGYDEESGYYLYIKFTTDGTAKLAYVTAANVGHTMQIATKEDVIAEATINEAITGGELRLTGGFNYDDIMYIFDALTK